MMTKGQMMHAIAGANNWPVAFAGFSQARIEAILELGATKTDCIAMMRNLFPASKPDYNKGIICVMCHKSIDGTKQGDWMYDAEGSTIAKAVIAGFVHLHCE